MKIELNNKKTIIYLYQHKLDFENMNNLNQEIKEIFIKLIKKFHLDFFGYSKVHVYENYKYGAILEIEKIYNNEFNFNIIDLKIIVHKNSPLYIELDDYFFLDNEEYFLLNNKYYINIKDIDNLLKYIELGKIKYNVI